MDKFDATYIDKELDEIGKRVKHPAKIYLIGGCAMSFRKLKETTKDVDIVFKNRSDYNTFCDALFGAQYYTPFTIKQEHEYLETTRVCENKDGFHLDLFIKKVCGKMVISDDMVKRAELYKKYGDLSVYLLSREDIFLFKALASAARKRDLDDMKLIYPGLDWAAIQKELFSQQLSSELIEHLICRLEEFSTSFELEVPILKSLKRQ